MKEINSTSVNYNEPDHGILAKYGFKNIESNTKSVREFQGTINGCPHISTFLIFINGTISVEEEHLVNQKKLKRIRLNLIKIDNDNELDIILRQTYPLEIEKLKR